MCIGREIWYKISLETSYVFLLSLSWKHFTRKMKKENRGPNFLVHLENEDVRFDLSDGDLRSSIGE